MAHVYVTFRVMPTSPDVDFTKMEQDGKLIIEKVGGKHVKTDLEPVAFGLKSLNLLMIIDEAKGGTEPIEKELSAMDNVESVEVTDVRRAVG